MYETNHCFKDINWKKQHIKYMLRNKKKKYFSLYNNNDTFDIFLSLFSYVKLFIISIYNTFIHYIQLLHQSIFNCHFFVLLIFMHFTFAFTLDNNSDIPRNLIISAYFPKKPLTRITYDMLFNKDKEKKELIINYEDYQNIYNSINGNKSEDNLSSKGNYDSSKEKESGKNIQKDINKDKIIEDTNLRDMISKIKKQKYFLQTWNSLMVNKNLDIFIFNNETIKTIIIVIFSFLYFYFFIKYTIYSEIKDSFLFNLLSIIIAFNILNILYQLEFYFSSHFFFALLIYINKCLIESVYINLKYNRKDFEIFSTSLIAFNILQFSLKFILLLNLTTFSGILSIFFFRTWLNYILFYICLFTFSVFLANCLESVTTTILKPIKNVFIFLVGIFNLVFSKIIIQALINKSSFLKEIYYRIFELDDKIDSLYFISDLFTLFCFGYIRGYLEFQLESFLLLDHFLESTNKSEIELFKKKEVLKKAVVWPFLFLICFLLCFLDIIKKEKMCLFMSIYLLKILISYFSNVYNISSCKIIFFVFCLDFLIINIEFSCCDDKTFLVNLIYSFTQVDKDIISMSIKIFISIMIYYFIITANFNITIACSESLKNENNQIKKEENEIKDVKNFNIKIDKDSVDIFNFLFNCLCIYIDLACSYFIICLLIAIYQYYEESIVIKIINLVTIMILFITKIVYLQEIENIFNYYFSNYIWLWLSLRLLALCNSELSIIFCLSHLNLQIFLYYFYMKRKNNATLNILFLITVIIRCWQIYSIFLITYIIIIILVIFFNYVYNNYNYFNEEHNEKDNEQKENSENYGIANIYVSLSFLFLIPIITFFLIYFKFPKYLFLLNYFDNIVKDVTTIINEYYENISAKENFDWIDSIEFNFIDYMINIIERFRTELEN